MVRRRLLTGSCIAVAALAPSSCDRPKAKEPRQTIGHHTTHLGVRVGSIRGGGYSVDVAPDEYVVIEHKNCPNERVRLVPGDAAEGFCIRRISEEQSRRFEAAMDRYKKYAVPLQTVSVEDWPNRPDGKPCRNQATDATLISLTWEGTKGAQIASFYEGCDSEEFASFYTAVLAVTDPLPIGAIIGKD